MTLHPFFNVLDVFLAVLEVFIYTPLVRAQDTGLWRFSRLNRHRPRTVLDVGCKVSRESILVSCREVQVLGTRWRIEVIEWMLDNVSRNTV
jgi:hypothetical protein